MTAATERGDLVPAQEGRFDEPATHKNRAAHNQYLHAGNFSRSWTLFSECGERLGGLDVLLVALLIALELLLFDGSEAGA